MLRKLDRKFVDALNDPEQFEKRLNLLSIARLASVLAMIVGVGAFFYTAAHLLPSDDLKASARSASLDEIVKPYFDLAHSAILLLFSFASFLTVLIHSEIRSLLVFKKLNENARSQ